MWQLHGHRELGFVTCTKAAAPLPPLPAALPAACHVATREMHGRYVSYKPQLCLLPARRASATKADGRGQVSLDWEKGNA